MRLKLERFGLSNKPSETPEQLEELVRCGDWGRGLRPPSHCPLPQGDNPSVRCGGQLPLHRGAIRLLRRLMEKKRESGAQTEKKPTGKAQRNDRTVRGSEAAKRLEHERFREDSAVRCRS